MRKNQGKSSIVSTAIMFLSCIFFASCSGNTLNENLLVGSWQSTEKDSKKIVYSFHEDGSGECVIYQSDGANSHCAQYTWAIENGKVVLNTFIGGETEGAFLVEKFVPLYDNGELTGLITGFSKKQLSKMDD